MFGSSEFSSTFFVKKSQSEAMLMVIEALKQLSMRVVRVDATNGVIVGKVSSSLKSMGEDLTIQMEKKEEGTLIAIHLNVIIRDKSLTGVKMKKTSNE